MAEPKIQILKVFLTALELEEKGHKFYQQCARSSKNARAKKIFQMLAQDELIHKKRIKLIYQSLNRNKNWTQDWKRFKVESEPLEEIFQRLTRGQKKPISLEAGDLAALEVGIGLEFASISFYEEHLSQSQEPEAKEFLEQMVKEEKTHQSILSDLKLFFKDPSAWYLEKERSGLDGV